MQMLASYDPFYPDDDGEPMSDSTLQARWITMLFTNLEALFSGDPNIFVAQNHLIYTVEGDNTTRVAPDVYVAFGRPKRDRGSYKVWDEDGLFPQVTFEVLSPSNRAGEMATKLAFYERYGVQEYYIYDPVRHRLTIYTRANDTLVLAAHSGQFVSPLLGIFFEMDAELSLYCPDGSPFVTFTEQRDQVFSARTLADALERQASANRRRADTSSRRAAYETQRADAETQRADAETQRADAETQRADAATAAADRLRQALRAAGIDPDTV